MYSHTGSGKRYAVNPTHHEARDVMWRTRNCLPPGSVEKLRVPLIWILSILAVAALVTGIAIPEAWWQDGGTNDLFGVLAMIALGGGAFATYRGWTDNLGMVYLANRFRRLQQEGAIIEVPFAAYYYLDERLTQAGLMEYAKKSYQLQVRDFDVLSEIANADKAGTINEETKRSIGAHFDEIVERVRASRDEAQAKQNGRLEGLYGRRRREGD